MKSLSKDNFSYNNSCRSKTMCNKTNSKYEKTIAVNIEKKIDNELMKSKIEPTLNRIKVVKDSINSIKSDILSIEEKYKKNYLNKEENALLHELTNTDWSFNDSQHDVNYLLIKANKIINKSKIH